MVAVSNVKARHGINRCTNTCHRVTVIDQPDCVLNAVIGGQVSDWCTRRRGGNQAFNFVTVRVRHQDRAGLRVERLDLAYPVVFLVRAREFMFTNAVGVVIGD